MPGIIIVAEHRFGELIPATLELVTVAQGLKENAGDKVAVTILADDPDAFVGDLSVPGVDEVIKVDVGEFQPDLYESALQALIEDRKPSLVLLIYSVNSFGYAPALAARGGYGFASDVLEIEYDDTDLVATREGYGGRVRMEVDFPGKETVIISVRKNTFSPATGTASPNVSTFNAPSIEPRSEHKEFIDPPAADVDLSKEAFVLAIGGGIRDKADVERFSELADVLDMTLGCSRPIADAGWLPKYRQVGQSGKTLSEAKLYIALGISGATQHLAGMQHVDNIIAVNKNPRAPIFQVARYGVVGDMYEIADALRSNL